VALVFSLLMTVSLKAERKTVTLTSADGSNSMDVELVRYDPAAGSIVYKSYGSMRHSTASTAAFSAATVEQLEKIYRDDDYDGGELHVELSGCAVGEPGA
jgi:hypothetical protein